MKEHVDELYEHRNDPDEWEDEPAEITVRPKSEVVSIRLPREEMDRLEAALDATDETLSTFVRRAIALRIQGEDIPTVLDVLTTSGFAVSLGPAVRAARAESYSGGTWVPDSPPALVSMLPCAQEH